MNREVGSRDAGDWDRAFIEEQLAEHQRRTREPDPLGKAALFSVSSPRPGPLGTLALECSRCRRETPVKLREAVRLSLPFTVHLPRRFHSLMRCPACGRRTWLRAHWRI